MKKTINDLGSIAEASPPCNSKISATFLTNLTSTAPTQENKNLLTTLQQQLTTNLTPLPMIHVACFMPDHVYLKTPNTPTPASLPEGMTVERRKGGMEVVISLQHGIIRVYAMKFGNAWRVTYIWVDLACILYGHTGRVLLSQKELVLALSLYRLALLEILLPEDADRAVPGLVKGCYTHLTSLEIPMQLKDVDGSILAALAYAKHSRVNKAALYVAGESVRFKGVKIIFAAYRKDIQLKDRYGLEICEEDKNILRFEAKLKGCELSKGFSGKEQERLKTFTIDDLYPVFLDCAKGLQGAYHIPGSAAVKLSKVERFITEIAPKVSSELSLEELVKHYVQYAGVAARHESKILKNVRAELSQRSSINFVDLFPSNMPKSAQVRPQRDRRDAKGHKTGVLDEVERHPDFSQIDPRIEAAYSKKSFVIYKNYDNSMKNGLARRSPLNAAEFDRRKAIYNN